MVLESKKGWKEGYSYDGLGHYKAYSDPCYHTASRATISVLIMACEGGTTTLARAGLRHKLALENFCLHGRV